MPLPVGGSFTKAGAPASGVFQVETATIVGVISTAGNATVTVTAAGMTGSPIGPLNVAVALDDDQDEVATKIRAVLAAHAVIGAFFTVSGATDKVVLTRTVSAANDGTMNIAYTNGTCVGLTPDATSDNTTAGVVGDWHGAPNGTYCLDTTNSAIYQNTGDEARPVWGLI
jgi:hypothetical protein